MPSIPPPLLSLLLLWLALPLLFPDLRRPPQPPPEGFVKLPPLLVNQGRPVTDRAGWAAERQRLESAWREILGPFPARVPLKPAVTSTEELPDHTRILLRYTTDADSPQPVTGAYLLVPKGFAGKRPGMVVLHQTTDETIVQPVGISGREAMHIALFLVRRGYVCIVPRNFLWSDPVKGYEKVTEELLARPPWKTGMAKMTWDAIRATDVLVARPEVDPERIGSIGHSLGGKEVIYHAAFDPRIRAAVSCEGGVGLAFSNWDADWYLRKQIQAPAFGRDNQEVVALIAPRPFLLIGGESADGAKSWPYIEANLAVWRLFDAEERIGLLRHPDGHDFPHPGADRERVFAWLDQWLRP